ncbi:hypothetical protein HN011_000726 [Eciton burchellii]|nr:hypothetical protein HN011_000726 [Eciton burchellii]
MEVSQSGRTWATRWNDEEKRTERKKFIRSKRLQWRIVDVVTLKNSPINRFVITSKPLKHSALMREIHCRGSRDLNLAAGPTFRGHRLCHPFVFSTRDLTERPRVSFKSFIEVFLGPKKNPRTIRIDIFWYSS